MSDQTATQIFNEELPTKLANNADSVKKVDAIYQFNIDGDNGGTWTVDLTKDGDFVSEGASDDADCTVTMKEEDFISMWNGKLPGAQAFMTGKLKISGDMGLAASSSRHKSETTHTMPDTTATSQAYLEGVRVLDLSRLLPGPFCTQLLADAGADVIKIEAPQGGDYARHYPPYLEDTGVGAFFDAINRGKKSVALDLRVPEGKELCEALIAQSDVLVESFRPGVMEKLGLGIEELRQRHPGLVICSITGYGQHGPHAHRAGHDINYLARAGLLWETRPRDVEHAKKPAEPIIPGFQVADIAGGSLHAAFGIVSALFRRTRTGQGAYLDISMTEGALGMHSGLHANIRQAPELAHFNLLAGDLPGYSVYQASCGGYVAVGALEPKFWTALTRLLDLPHLEHDGASIGERGEAARAEVAAKIASKTRDEWAEIFEAHDVCCDPVLSPLEALDEAMHLARGSFFEAGGVTYTGSALGVVESAKRRAPLLGEHTHSCLEELIPGKEELDALWEAGVVSGPRQG